MKQRAVPRAIVLAAVVDVAGRGGVDVVTAIARSGQFRIRTSVGTRTPNLAVPNPAVPNPAVPNPVLTGLPESGRSETCPVRTFPRRVALGTVSNRRMNRHPAVMTRSADPAGRDAEASGR
jgi:hypothetical protein